MTLEGRAFSSAATQAAAGRDLNLWLWLLLFGWGALIGVADRVPILSLPLAALFGSFEYVMFREVFWSVTENRVVLEQDTHLERLGTAASPSGVQYCSVTRPKTIVITEGIVM